MSESQFHPKLGCRHRNLTLNWGVCLAEFDKIWCVPETLPGFTTFQSGGIKNKQTSKQKQHKTKYDQLRAKPARSLAVIQNNSTQSFAGTVPGIARCSISYFCVVLLSVIRLMLGSAVSSKLTSAQHTCPSFRLCTDNANIQRLDKWKD